MMRNQKKIWIVKHNSTKSQFNDPTRDLPPPLSEPGWHLIKKKAISRSNFQHPLRPVNPLRASTSPNRFTPLINTQTEQQFDFNFSESPESSSKNSSLPTYKDILVRNLPTMVSSSPKVFKHVQLTGGKETLGNDSIVATENQVGDKRKREGHMEASHWFPTQENNDTVGILSKPSSDCTEGIIASSKLGPGFSVQGDSDFLAMRVGVNAGNSDILGENAVLRVTAGSQLLIETETVQPIIQRVENELSKSATETTLSKSKENSDSVAAVVLPIVQPILSRSDKSVELPHVGPQGFGSEEVVGFFESPDMGKIDELFERVGRKVQSLGNDKEDRVVKEVFQSAFESTLRENSEIDSVLISTLGEGEKNLIEVSVIESVINMGLKPTEGTETTITALKTGVAKGKNKKVKSPIRKSSRVLAINEFKVDSEIRAMELKKKRNDFVASSKTEGKGNKIKSLKGKDVKKEMLSKEIIVEVLEECNISLDDKGVKAIQNGIEEGLRKVS